MSQLEKAMLKLLVSSDRGLNWYGLAIRLSDTDTPNQSDMMKVLKRFTSEGLLEFHEKGERWTVTEAGLALIKKLEKEN